MAKQLLNYPGKELKCSDQWFMRFYRRYGVALRRKTHAAQTDPKQLAPAITKFHSKLLMKSLNLKLTAKAKLKMMKIILK